MTKEIQLTKGQIALVDDDMFDYLNQWKWHFQSKGYAARSVRKGGKKMILMHRLIIDVPKGMQPDHINRNKIDNRKCNLRICIGSQNQANRNIQNNNTSGHKGISWNKREHKWVAQIQFCHKVYHLGNYRDIEKAIDARELKEKEIFGEFASLNE